MEIYQNKKWIVSLFLLFLSGCSDIEDARINISYGAWNIDKHGVDDVDISGLYREKSLPRNPGFHPHFGSSYFSRWRDQKSSRVSFSLPDEIDVSWTNRIKREDGSITYGDRSGPYKVKLRSRIPDDVIRMVAKKGYQLKLGFSVGRLPILVCWKVERSAHPKPGTIYVRQGGDC